MVAPKHCKEFQVGVLGYVLDEGTHDSEEKVGVAVDAFHWPSPAELENTDGWFDHEQDGVIQ